MAFAMSFQDNDQAQKRICLGKIKGAHGVKGLVKIACYGSDKKALEEYGPLYTSQDGHETLTVKLKNQTGQNWLAEIEGITDKEQADLLNGTELWLDRDQLPETGENEFYVEDLIGLKAEDKSGNEEGTVTSVQNFGAGDLLEIKPKGQESFFLVLNKANVLDINIEAGKITIDKPEEI